MCSVISIGISLSVGKVNIMCMNIIFCVRYSGAIICAHCNCMAGAGEACSHISALLYAVMAKARIQNETTVHHRFAAAFNPH